MVLKGNSNCPLIVNRWCLGWYIVAMLLLIGPARDGRYRNTYIFAHTCILLHRNPNSAHVSEMQVKRKWIPKLRSLYLL